MRNTKEITLKALDRKAIRDELIKIFLEEEPGTGKGELCSFYNYYVDTLRDGKRIIIKRPARLNKGFDFEVHVEDLNFGTARFRTMPSHKDIVDDLEVKFHEKPEDAEKVRECIEELYECKSLNDAKLSDFKFETGHPIDAILKSIKWLFIEQDMTYWNWSGRAMLHNHLKNL